MIRRRLAGPWELRFEGEDAWRDVAVPGCWEQLGGSKARVGPAWYRTRIARPPMAPGDRAWLRFEGVSYHARVFVDGVEVGEHLGLWDAFTVAIPAPMRDEVELTVRVEKPAGLTGGPDTASLPGRFPMKETLSGFLPYVWGHIFGGIWQDVALETSGPAKLARVDVRGWADGRLHAEVQTNGAPATARVTVFDPDGRSVLVLEDAHLEGGGVLAGAVPDPEPWCPEAPRLYRARVEAVLDDGTVSDLREQAFGLRTLVADGSTLRLNGEPIYPRMALSWGWYFDHLHANPGRDEVRRDLERLRSLGFNGVKLCLWVPPAYYLELCDELGMLVWLELPMWLPEPSEFFLRQTPVEYERIVRQVRHHPSIVLYTLGCELNTKAGADLLGPLFRRVKQLVGDALVRDNSGSGEAYGGLLDEFAEFHDYHFYAEPPAFGPLLDYFDPGWRDPQPFLFGEYADSDGFRDQQRALERHGGAPWWMRDDPELNPQGARWQYDAVHLVRRVREAGLWERQAQLAEVGRRQSLLHRKVTLEATRARRVTSGYVVTGERDTPISTAGMWDYDGELKFAPDEFRSFNDDLVVVPAFDRRRRWEAGGDRPAPFERWCVVAGTTQRVHLVASHYGRGRGPATVRWSVVDERDEVLAGGTGEAALKPGQVRGVGLAHLAAPAVDTPVRLELRAEVEVGGDRTRNAWSLWVFPESPLPPFALHDPLGYLPGLARSEAAPEPAPLVATAWDARARDHVVGGGAAVVVLPHTGPAAPADLQALPFWREGVKLLEPHPAWGDFPHRGVAELQFYGMTPDHALPRDPLPGWQPVLRRVDARTAAVHDYAGTAEVGRGRVLFTTLRLGGGIGDQPVGIERNPAARHLLGCFLRWVAPAS